MDPVMATVRQERIALAFLQRHDGTSHVSGNKNNRVKTRDWRYSDEIFQ